MGKLSRIGFSILNQNISGKKGFLKALCGSENSCEQFRKTLTKTSNQKSNKKLQIQMKINKNSEN